MYRYGKSKKFIVIVIVEIVVIVGLVAALLIARFGWPFGGESGVQTPGQATATPELTPTPSEAPLSLVDETANTIATRFRVPEGFERVTLAPDSYGYYLRNYPLRPYGSVSHLFDGTENPYADKIGIFDQEIANRDIQQCADACMRLYAEYHYTRQSYDKISFDFYTTPVFHCDYATWASGQRIKLEGDTFSWYEYKTETSYAYESFQAYLSWVFTYANTDSLQNQLTKVSVEDISVGDMFILTASQNRTLNAGQARYGHVVFVVDMAVNPTTGEKLFLMAQGSTPATETYLLESDDPDLIAWHRLDENGQFSVATLIEGPDGSVTEGTWKCPASYLRRFS